eukprot:5250597-Pleurochrysis_carterae.AAC.2
MAHPLRSLPLLNLRTGFSDSCLDGVPALALKSAPFPTRCEAFVCEGVTLIWPRGFSLAMAKLEEHRPDSATGRDRNLSELGHP